MNKHIIIRKDDETGELVADVLMDGYNIIEQTIYDMPEKLQAILDHIDQE